MQFSKFSCRRLVGLVIFVLPNLSRLPSSNPVSELDQHTYAYASHSQPSRTDDARTRLAPMTAATDAKVAPCLLWTSLYGLNFPLWTTSVWNRKLWKAPARLLETAIMIMWMRLSILWMCLRMCLWMCLWMCLLMCLSTSLTDGYIRNLSGSLGP